MTAKDELRVADYLGHILDAIHRIETYVEQVPNERAFSADLLVMR